MTIDELVYQLTCNYNFKHFNTLTFIIFSILIFLVSYIFFYKVFNSILCSIAISILISSIPYTIIASMIKKIRISIRKTFPSYVLSLKNYTDVDNNIIHALLMSEANKNIKKYIDKFNVSVSNGVSVPSAFETLKSDINIKEISQFISLMQNCYLNGGNFSKIIDKYAYFQNKLNIEKEKENESLMSSKLTLAVLVLLSIMLLFGFVLKSEEYSYIILNTIGGKFVLLLNIITYFVIYIIYIKIDKMEE